MLTALLTISGNGSDLTGVAFLQQHSSGRELLSFRKACGQVESMAGPARLLSNSWRGAFWQVTSSSELGALSLEGKVWRCSKIVDRYF